MMKIGVKDKKILYELDADSSASYSEIARKVGLSKHGLALRVQKMEKEKIILRFVTAINPEAFGATVYKVYIKLQDADLQREKEIMESLASSPYIGWLVSCIGNFDLMFAMIVERPAEFEPHYRELTKGFSKCIKEKTVTQTIGTIEYNRKHLLEKPEGARSRMIFKKSLSNFKPDRLDMQLLRIISQHAKSPTHELVKATKMSGRVVRYRIKRMERAGIISGYRCVFDRTALGLQYYKIFLNTSGMEEITKKKLISYCEYSPSITAVVTCIGAWDIEVELEVPSVEEFQDVLRDIRNTLSSELRDFDYVLITQEHKLDYYTDITI